MLPTTSAENAPAQADMKREAAWLDEGRSRIEAPLRINLWLVRDVSQTKPGPWMLERVELNTEKLRSEYRFKQQKAAETSLAERLWDSIRDNLPVENTDRFLTSPDFFLDLGTISLNRMRINCNRNVSGPQRALLSFRRTVGTIDGLFRPGCAPDPMSEVRADLATRTLVDLVMPLTNLVDTILPEDNPEVLERVNACLTNLRHARHELDFYALLLSRYIAQTERNEQDEARARAERSRPAVPPFPDVAWPEPQQRLRPKPEGAETQDEASTLGYRAR